MCEHSNDTIPVTPAYYEYWCDGVLQKCFKDHDSAVKYCRNQYARYKNGTHIVYKTKLDRIAIFCMTP